MRNHGKLLGVVTDSISWKDFSILAKVIEDQAKACNYLVMFYNLNGEYELLDTMLQQLQADAYLISRQIFIQTQGKEVMRLQKPFALIGEPNDSIRSSRSLTKAVTYVCEEARKESDIVQ